MPNLVLQHLWFMFVDVVVDWRNLGNSSPLLLLWVYLIPTPYEFSWVFYNLHIVTHNSSIDSMDKWKTFYTQIPMKQTQFITHNRMHKLSILNVVATYISRVSHTTFSIIFFFKYYIFNSMKHFRLHNHFLCPPCYTWIKWLKHKFFLFFKRIFIDGWTK